jgi:hypothetical protein
MGLDGVEIFTNSSASHHELRKLSRRIELIKEATLKVSFVGARPLTFAFFFPFRLSHSCIPARRYLPLLKSAGL